MDIGKADKQTEEEAPPRKVVAPDFKPVRREVEVPERELVPVRTPSKTAQEWLNRLADRSW